MSIFLLIIASIVLGDVAVWVWADRKARRTKRPKAWRPLAGLWCALMLGYLVWFMTFRAEARTAHAWMPIGALAAIYLWHLFVLPATLICIGGAWLARGLRKLWTRWRAQPAATAIPDLYEAMKAEEMGVLPSRRQFLGAAVVAAPPLLTGGAVAFALNRLYDFRIRPIELVLPQLPQALDGMTIAHVSDLHVGRFTRSAALPAIADAVNKLKADLVLFTGDLIDLTLADLPAGIDFLRKLDPRGGLFICEGNHDLIENPDGFEFGVRKADLPLLLDESAIVSVRDTQLQVMGLTWQRGDAGIVGSMSRIIPQRRADLFQILLAHHPHAFDPAAAVGIPLTLAGHTHGGQLMLNERLGAGPAMFRYWSGAYRQKDSALVVSNGIGNWFPLRINAPAEIVHLTLRSKPV